MNNILRPVAPAPNSFLPADYIREKSERRANLLTLTLFAIVMGGVIVAFGVTNRSWQQLRSRQATVNELYVQEGQKLEQLKALEAQRAQMMDKAEITAALLEKVPRWAMLGELTLRMPTDMRLDSLALKSTRTDTKPQAVDPKAAKPGPTPLVKSLTDKVSGKKVEPPKPKIAPPKFTYALTIAGTAQQNNDIADYIASLKQSPVLDKVEMAFIKVVREKDTELRKFEVTATLRIDADSVRLSESLRKLVTDRAAQLAGETNDGKAQPATAAVTEKEGQ